MRWLLLTLTLASVWLTLDALRGRREARDAWLSGMSSVQTGEPKAPPPAKRPALERRRSSLFAVGGLAWLFAGVSLVLALLTFREFLE